MKICIDAGHGGKDGGAYFTSKSKRINEKDINLSVALKLKDLLIKNGHKVIMTRASDSYVGLTARSSLANKTKCDLFLALHCNGSTSSSAEGIETFASSDSSSASKRYRKQVQSEMIRAFPKHKNRGEKSANFSVLRKTNMPAILLEMEFVTNSKQSAFLASKANQNRIALAVFQGITSSTKVKKPKVDTAKINYKYNKPSKRFSWVIIWKRYFQGK